MVQSPFYLLAGQVSSPFFPGVSGTQTEAWGGGGTRESPAYWIPGTSTPKRRLVLGALIRARLGLFGTLGAFTHAPSSSPKPTGDDQLSPHRLRSLPSRAHRRPSLQRERSDPGNPSSPTPGLSFAERGRQVDSEPPRLSPAARAPRSPGRPSVPGPLTCPGEPPALRRRPLALPPAPPRPPRLYPPGIPPPAPPRLAQVILGRGRARPSIPGAWGTAPGAPGWDTGVAAPPGGVLALLPGLGPFWGFQVWYLGDAQASRPSMPGQTSPRAKREKGPLRYPTADGW